MVLGAQKHAARLHVGVLTSVSVPVTAVAHPASAVAQQASVIAARVAQGHKTASVKKIVPAKSEPHHHHSDIDVLVPAAPLYLHP